MKMIDRIKDKLRLAHMRTFTRTTPIDFQFGFGRGEPIDRYYIEKFLDEHRSDVRGTVLEVADPAYTRKFGDDRVERSEVLHAVEGNDQATFVGDLSTGENVPSDRYDCIILTEVFQVVYDLPGVVQTLHRSLRPGGVVLATMNGISQICHPDREIWGDFWRFTDLSAQRLFADVFGANQVKVRTYGNVLAASGLLYGLASHEVGHKRLDVHDPDFQVTIAVRVQKAG